MEIGKKAPAFSIKNQNKEKVQLKDFLKSKFDQLNAQILGVSPDSPDLHCKFIEKKDLVINLLSDENHQLCEKYGVWQAKKMYGREYIGIVRTTFLIDPQGKITKKWDKVKVTNHAEEVLKFLKSLVN